MSAIPIIGPALGIAAAAAVIAFGFEQQANIASAQRGGIVGAGSAGSGGLRDRIPMLLEQDELIVPKALTPDFIQAVGRPDAASEIEDATETEL